jgi:antitoxin component of RelBE/YafQ-DinJ toxin-antitoxin module
MAKTQALTSRIDTEILGMAEALLGAHGLTAQDYCRMAIARVVSVGGIPWNTIEHDKAVANIKRQRRQQRKRDINALQEGLATNEQTPTHD